MCNGIIVADNYRRAQRAYTIGRPRIQKLPDKKLGANNSLGELAFILSRAAFLHTTRKRESRHFANYLFRRRDFSTLNLPTRLDLRFYRRPHTHEMAFQTWKMRNLCKFYRTSRASLLVVASLTFRTFGKIFSKHVNSKRNVQIFCIVAENSGLEGAPNET